MDMDMDVDIDMLWVLFFWRPLTNTEPYAF